MRILVISPVYPPYKGGMGSVAAQEVQLIRDAGHTVRVVTPNYTDKPRETDEQTVLMYPLYAWGNAAILPWRELWKEIKEAEVIHLHYPFFGTALPVVIMAKFAKKRLVVSWHMHATAEKGAWVRRGLFFLHGLLEEPLVKRFAHALCVSSAEYGKLMQLPEKKTLVVPFGVDDRRFTRGRNTAFREERGVSAETPVFLFVGGMDRAHAFKGVSVLLHAFAKVPAETQAKLWLVGDGDMRTLYEQLAKELKLEARVLFLGSVLFSGLPSVYQAADVHVLPSVSGAEAYGLVTCEAAATGIPSIVSSLPGVRSLVDHEKTGLHVSPGSVTDLAAAITRLAKNIEERRDFGARAHEKISKIATLQEEQAALLRAYTREG